jgi:hypothetical protein
MFLNVAEKHNVLWRLKLSTSKVYYYSIWIIVVFRKPY